MECLVIDDEWLPRGGTAKAIESVAAGAIVIEAASLSDAYKALEKAPTIALVVLDLNLEDSQGIETLKTFRAWCDEHELSPRIVVLSGAGDDNPELVIDVLENYGTGFIQKSGPERIFKHALSITLEGGIFIPPIILGQIQSKAAATQQNTSSTTADRALTARELEVAGLVVKGFTYKRIALELEKRQGRAISEHTVRSHVGNIAWKLGIADNVKAKSGVMAEIARRELRFKDTEL